MRAWIPEIKYGAGPFGYSSFDNWLAHRTECLDSIERVSPAALLRKIDRSRAPRIVQQASSSPDATHSPVFMVKFKEIADARGVACEIVDGPQPFYGAAIERLAEILLPNGK